MEGRVQLQRQYTPGTRVVSEPVPEAPSKKRRRVAPSSSRSAFPGCCTDVLEPILRIMVQRQEGLSVIKLSMVNKWFHKEISENVEVWRALYMQWRGPIGQTLPTSRVGVYMARLRPTLPRSLPNFRDKPPRITMLLAAEKPFSDMTVLQKAQSLRLYKKITVLRLVQRCGVCGTARHATKAFWSLGMRLCKYCAQANLVSSKVLFERYWVHLGLPIQGHISFIDAITSTVFYFECRVTPCQRTVFSVDPIDFPGGIRPMWFFWKPHLAKVLDMERLARDADAKDKAASLIRSAVRRNLLQRLIRGSKPGKRDRRSLLFKISRTQLLDKMDWYNDMRMVGRLDGPFTNRLHSWEDTVLPLEQGLDPGSA